MIRRRLLACALAALCAAPVTAFAADGETPTVGTLEISSTGTVHRFEIEIADEPGERARGLMFRQEMADDAGMLFIYPRERIASFWMKNTYIPLDLLFIANDGRIVQIAPRMVPFSLESTRSDEEVRAVLEINGGLAERLGIVPGDTVTLYR